MQQPMREHEYPVLFAGSELAAGPAARILAERLVYRGLRVITTRTRDDLRSAIAVHSQVDAARIGVALVSWDLLGSEYEVAATLDEIQRLSDPPPIVLLSERADEPAAAGRTAGSFWLPADSPHFVADQVEWLVRTYALRSQVLGALAAGAGAAAGSGGIAGRAGP